MALESLGRKLAWSPLATSESNGALSTITAVTAIQKTIIIHLNLTTYLLNLLNIFTPPEISQKG
jgi:hypothetical protein